MKSKRCVFSLVLILTAIPALAKVSAPVRVGLISSIGSPTSLTVSCSSAFEIAGMPAIAAGQSVTFSASEGRIQVALPDSSTQTLAGPVRSIPKDTTAVFEILSPKVRYKRYRGVLELSGDAGLTVVNELSLEDYVRGVVPIEIPASFQPEAQKALVVAIRTYALKNSSRHKSSGFSLCDGTDCQGFSGAAKEAPWADKLVEATRGQIAVYKGEPICATYSTDCGGATQSGEDSGLSKSAFPYLRSVIDNPQPAADDGATENRASDQKSEDYCARDPYHSWSKTYTLDDLSRAFSKSQSSKIGKFESMEFIDYDSSGRVKTVLVKGDTGEVRINGNRFRGIVGMDAIKSTRMTLSVSPDGGTYTIAGKGYGHGLGLCAFGANGYAKAHPEATYIDILKRYYAGIEIKQLAEEKVDKGHGAEKPREAPRDRDVENQDTSDYPWNN